MKEWMGLRKSNRSRGHRTSRRLSDLITLLLLAVLPPVGVVLLWRRNWRTSTKAALTAAAAAVLTAAVLLIPSADSRVSGGIELVGRERDVEVYGPALPTAMVTGYTASSTDSVFSAAQEDETEYVYAAKEAQCYHRSTCKFAYASSQKLTPYEAYYLGYKPCDRCNPPAYTPGS